MQSLMLIGLMAFAAIPVLMAVDAVTEPGEFVRRNCPVCRVLLSTLNF